MSVTQISNRVIAAIDNEQAGQAMPALVYAMSRVLCYDGKPSDAEIDEACEIIKRQLREIIKEW